VCAPPTPENRGKLIARQISVECEFTFGATFLPDIFSCCFSHISGITVLGVPAEIYRYGLQYWAVIISGFLVSLTVATVYVPIFVKLQLTSSYQVILFIADYNLSL
jgi:Na+/proline symporter